MTWINARRIYRRDQYARMGRRRPGRPPERAHVVGVWVIDPATHGIHKAWHKGRTLCTVAGPVSTSAVVLVEVESVAMAPDWQARELKKRLRREGFGTVTFVAEKQLAEMVKLSKRPRKGEISLADSDRLPE